MRKAFVIVFGVGCAMGSMAAVGCSASDDESEEVSASIEPIIGGVAASDYPEAAILNMKSTKGSWACSAALIAPKVVLTAGHCVDGMTSFDVVVGTKAQTTTSGETYDWAENGATNVNPKHHDVGLVYLSSPITLTSYPTIATAGLASGAKVTNVGRILNGTLTSSLWKASVTIVPGSNYGYPFDYASTDVIEHGDSGGPVFQYGTHTIVAVNSGAGGGIQVLARVDLLAAWIQSRIASHGGMGTSTDAGVDAAKPADAGTDVKDSGTVTDSGAKADTGAADAGGGTKCVANEAEPNDSYAKANALGASACGALSTTTDADYYTFTAPIGTTKVVLSGTGVFTIGYSSPSGCTPVLSGQTGVAITVSGAARGICIAVGSPNKTTGSYVLSRQ